LGLTVARHGLRFVEALQRAVVAFVEPPVALHRDPHPVHRVEHDPERADRALQHRGEGDVDADSLTQQVVSGTRRLFTAERRKVDVGPAGEKVVDIPGALPVAGEDQSAGERSIRSGLCSGHRGSLWYSDCLKS
jgi:hypothetical protein